MSKSSRIISRRRFIRTAGAIAGFAALSSLPESGIKLATPASAQVAQVPLDPKTLLKYQDELPRPGIIDGTLGGLITVTASEFDQKVLPLNFIAGPLGGKTRVWGYNLSYPGPTIEATTGVPLNVRYINSIAPTTIGNLGETLQGFIPVDYTLMWANPSGQPPFTGIYRGPVPISTHLHGGEVGSASDGGPDAWFTPGGAAKGPAWVQEDYAYPNQQQAATLWYHDHALGMTRLNVYAGLAGFYLLRDPPGAGEALLNLPRGPDQYTPYGNYEREIVIQDRIFDINGQLLFPHIGINPEHPYWLPEFFGDTIVVNGKVWPKLRVEGHRYRFRFLNGSNARFYSLALINPATGAPGPAFWQIGTDGGLLDRPVKLNDPVAITADLPSPRLVIAPGERADVIIDFAGWTGTWILDNNAKAPFPNGAPANPKTVGQIMQFIVGGTTTDTSFDPSIGYTGPGTGPNLRPSNPIVRLVNPLAVPPAPAVPYQVFRSLTLNEVMGAGGPLKIIINNSDLGAMSSGYAAPVTEFPQVGSTELWEIINLTADTHPIHLHLIQFQLLSRQLFQLNKYVKAYNAALALAGKGPGQGPPLAYVRTVGTQTVYGGNPDVTPYLQQKAMPPDDNEYGWKDTVRMNHGEVTRIVVRFAPQHLTSVTPGVNPFDGFDPTAGPGYVWHCHIIDHEDNEMMRRYKVQATLQTQAQSAPIALGPVQQLSYVIPAVGAAATGVLLKGSTKVKVTRSDEERRDT